MSSPSKRRPSPALAVAVLALVAALAGTAIADPGATTAISKKKTKKIAKKEVQKQFPIETSQIADEAVTNNKVEAGSLEADRLSDTAQIELRGALAYAQINHIGTPSLVAERTSGITAVTRPAVGVYCLTVSAELEPFVFNNAGAPVRSMAGSVEFGNSTTPGEATVAPRGANTTCGNNLLEVRTFNGAAPALANNVSFTVLVG